ncbi:PAS domain S-box protein [Pontibacter diazotrophicus]|uniref:histidine kinase n=1 Tax=Pontibacter diazotrophicus TaxID=1400979 RepID=A0A3D8LBX1_9BACT|nr:PAS domain-containing protein [Pontibacter diazotrophicus]RDV14939.1 PAS domain S-box protein [Pontibacter diazotrophicus]
MSKSGAGNRTETARESAERVRRNRVAEANGRENKQLQNVAEKKLLCSEMLLRETQSIASIGSFSYDIEADEMEWTDEMYYIHGYQPGDAALNFSGIVSHTHPTDRERVERIIHHALQNRENYAFTMHYVLPCGESRYIHNIGRFVTEAGKSARLIGTAQDITSLRQAEAEVKQKNLALHGSHQRLLREVEERKLAETALKESEEKWRSLVENTPDAISRFDHELRFIFANSSAQKKLGLSPGQLLGKTYAELGLPEEFARFAMASFRHVFETGQQKTRYVSLNSPAGRKHYYSISVPELDASGRVKTVLNISREITDVKEKENLLNAVLNSSTSGIGAIRAIRDQEKRIVDFSFLHVNRQAQAMLQQTAEQLQSMTLLEVLPSFKESGLLDKCIRTVDTGEVLYETLYYGYDHRPAWYQLVAVKLEDGLVMTFADINEQKLTALALEQANIVLRQEIAERKEAERVARLEKEFKDSIIEHATDGISAFDKDGAYTAWNRTVELFTGIKREEVIGRKFREVFPALAHSELAEKIDRALNGEHTQLRNIPFMNREGYYDAKVVPNFDQKGELIGGIIVVHDITESLKNKDKAIAQNLLQQKMVVNAILEAQEDERKRIAEAMHNGLGQLLYGIRLYVNQLEIEDIVQDKNYRIRQHIDQLLAEAIDSTRNLSYELTPAILKDFGLKIALGELCEKLSKAGLTISLATYEVSTQLEENVELVTYRITQELINNVLKHANATEAEIEIEQKNDKLVICVSDNGNGFKQEDRLRQGIGLYSITNWVKLLNGQLDIMSKENTGSKIKVVLSLEP